MTRLTFMLAVWMGMVSAASASLTPRKETPLFSRAVPPAGTARLAPQVLEPAARPGTRSEFLVTEQTEVTLDGKPYKYADIPANASILRMELAPDQKTVRRIHFRTQR